MARADVVITDPESRKRVCGWVMQAPVKSRVTIRGPKRTIEQNKRLWPMLTDVARQATRAGKKRTTTEWKDLFSGAMKAAAGGLEAVPGLEGGFMILGLHTSEMTIPEMIELQDYIEAWGAQHGVTFSEPESEAARDTAGDNPAVAAL